MKFRAFIPFISIMCLLMVIAGALAGFDPKESSAATQTAFAEAPKPAQAAANTPESTLAVQPSEVVTSTPAPPTQVPTGEQTSRPGTVTIRDSYGRAFGFLNRVNNMAQELWPLLAGLGLLILVTALIVRAGDEAWGYRIEFDPLQNGTGDTDFNESLTGMNVYMREKLIAEIKDLHDTIAKYSHRTSAGAEFPMRLTLPQDAETLHTLDKVVDALGEESPKYLKPLLSLWHYLFPGRGLRVRATLQSNDDPTRPLRITFEFLDLGTQKNSKVHTFEEEQKLTPSMPPWILCGKDVPPSKERSAQAPSPPAGSELRRGALWQVKVARALTNACLYADAATYYEQALTVNKNNQQVTDDLVSCQNRLAFQAGSVAGFAAAMRLEESGLLEAAVKSYSALFSEPDDVKASRQLWPVAMRSEPGSVGEALDTLAGLYREKLCLHDQSVELYKRAVQEGYRPSAAHLKRIQNEQADELAEAGGLLLDNAQWVAAEMYLTKAAACMPDHELTTRLQARLKSSRPTQENKEALADFELGKIYQAQGRQASATEHYIKAIEKQPDYAEAKKALSDILRDTRSLRYRFELLANQTLRWLAVELFRQETDRLAGDDLSKKARYHNFYGAYYISRFWFGSSFATLAEKELLEAKRICPSWFMSYKQLGDLCLLKARVETNGRQDPALAKKAAAWYKIALSKSVMKPDGMPFWMGHPLKLNLQVQWAAAELLTCPEDLSRLWACIREAEAFIRKPDQAFKDIRLDKEFEDFYRSLAIWYALVDYREQKSKDQSVSTQPGQARFWAWFYLICAVLLDPDRLRQVNMNPVQKALYTKEQYQHLKTNIELRRQEKLAKTPEEPFTFEDVRNVMKELNLEFEKELKEK